VGEPTWTVLVPVKRLDAAKSRLRGALDGVPHHRLALALALDTVTAVLACRLVRQVLVVTDDPAAGAALRRLGARVVGDPPHPGLNPAVTHGASMVTGRVAALAADLPALRPAELRAALSDAGRHEVRHFVPDLPGTGTVLLTAPPGVPLDPRFGVGSAAAHAASGAHPLTGCWPSLRRDVDIASDLHEAAGIGLGRHTAALTTRPTTPTVEARPAAAG